MPHPADLHGRLDRVCHPAGRGPGDPDGLPDLLPRLRTRSRFPRACSTSTSPATIPTAFVDFFEKIQSLEKKKPGTMSKVFSTHPMTDDRIKAAQEEIQKILAPKPEYVVTTSEFNDVKARLTMLHNRRKVDTGRSEPSAPAPRSGQRHRSGG